MEIPVDELPENLLFAPIPLEARIVEGVASIQQLNKYQRANFYKQAQSPQKTAEVRVKINELGKASIKFTEDVYFPENVLEEIKAEYSKSSKRELSGSLKRRKISIYAVKGEEADPDDEHEITEPVIDGWYLESIDKSGMEVNLNFRNPLAVSQSRDPDLLLTQIEFGEFKTTSGVPLRDCIIKVTMIPR